MLDCGVCKLFDVIRPKLIKNFIFVTTAAATAKAIVSKVDREMISETLKEIAYLCD